MDVTESRKIDRREFSRSLIGLAGTVLLMDSLFTGCTTKKHLSVASEKIVEKPAAEILDHWAVELNEICNDLKTDSISQLVWQEQISKLFGRIELKELLGFINFDQLKRKMEFPDLGVTTKGVIFPKIADLPARTVFTKKIFGLKKDRAIIPHGHSNMASAHFVLGGKFHLRHYDKVKEEKQHLIIRQTVDKSISAGDFSSISDKKDNVHWFIARSEEAFTFDVIMTDLNAKKYDIHNIDISEGEKISGDLLRARKMTVNSALKKYGKDHHIS